MTGYYLKAGIDGNTSTDRMPKNWEFQASNDGQRWTLLDAKSNERRWSEGEKRFYPLVTKFDYQYYRLVITTSADKQSILRLTEFGLQRDRLPKMLVSFDSATSSTNFLTPKSSTFWETANPFPHWVRYDLSEPRPVSFYSLICGTYGQESTQRMPKDWALQGSKDGLSWETIDHRTGEKNWVKGEQRFYEVEKKKQFSYYRLLIYHTVNSPILRLSYFTLGFDHLAFPQNSINSTTVKQYSSNRIEIDVFSDQDQWLVFSDTFHPGWKASVNGISTQIMEAYLVFKAIKVNKGYNRVVFEFNNNILTVSSIVMIIEGALLSFLCLFKLFSITVTVASKSN